MKKSILTFGFAALGMMSGVFAQNEVTTISDVNALDILPTIDDDAFAKADTIDYIANKVQNWYLGLAIGGSYSMGENTRFDNFWSQTRPSFRFEIGRNMYPQFGIRFTLHYLNQRGRANWEIADFHDQYGLYDGNYDFSMGAGFVDGVFDFKNIIWGYKEDRRFNIKAYVGLGAFYTFNFDKKKCDWLIDPTYRDVKNDKGEFIHHAGDKMNAHRYWVDTKNKFYFAGHVGLLFDFRLTDSWTIDLDMSFNGTDDGYNGVRYRRVYDSYVDVMAGLTYIMKDKGRSRLTYAHYTDQARVDFINDQLNQSNDELEQALAPIVLQHENVSYDEMLQTTVSFYIDKTFVTDAQKRNIRSVAKFMETHPDIDVIITGYADVQTAYPKYNMMLSQKRAQAVYEILTKEYGVDPNRLSMDYKGDEEQPFSIVNEWNRAVVFYIKHHDADFTPGVQEKGKQIKLNSHESGRLNQTDSKETRRP